MSRVYGGLGNQMFQYAAALGVGARLGMRVVVDASWFRHVGPQVGRTYGLSAFGIEPGIRLRDRVRLLVERPEAVREDDGGDPRELQEKPGPVLLDGYWQSPVFFAHCEGRVREAFRFRLTPPPTHATLLQELRGAASVSVHVRRGDYLAPKRQSRFGMLPPEYYEAAMALVADRVEAARFVVFSDDAEWCRQHFAGHERVTIAPSTPDAPAEDLRLMAACAHHVVANSSFSWWGAWLAENPDKLVVAPKVWYADPSLARWELVPPEWVRV